jgi:chromosome segregation ATPase
MSDEIKAQVDMLHRDVLELRSVDNRLTTLIEDQGRTLEVLVEAIPKVTGDIEHLKSQAAQMFQQQMEHGKILLKHAELHTQHAESIAATRDQARRATESASDLSKEWKDAAQAIDRHVSGIANTQSGAIQRLATAQEQMNEQREKDREEQQLQTAALNQLVKAVSSKRFAVYVAAGAFVGGLIVAIAQKVFL